MNSIVVLVLGAFLDFLSSLAEFHPFKFLYYRRSLLKCGFTIFYGGRDYVKTQSAQKALNMVRKSLTAASRKRL